jgi:hypothetical protein
MTWSRQLIVAVSVGAAWTAATFAAPEAPREPVPHPLLRKYQGKEAIPDGLVRAYAAFVAAIPDGEVGRFCLPHAVTVTRDPRPFQDREYGTEMNLPFLRKGFAADVLSFRKEPDDSYLIRTGTSALWFVETRSGA